ncbi:MAG: LEA type 2 family protein [Gammaproteobacteria bacterium]|nr:LEA type 2 family protein [Gammaproteobacteria bacterium]
MKRVILLVTLLLQLAGCTGLGINERPVVTLTNLRMLESDGLSMRFAIDLSITNPGPVTIPVDGLSWNLELEGSRILTGVSNQVPVLEPFTEVPLTLEASTNLTGMVELFTRLLNRQSEQFDYQLETRLGLAGFRLPITYTDSGSIALDR